MEDVDNGKRGKVKVCSPGRLPWILLRKVTPTPPIFFFFIIQAHQQMPIPYF